MPRFLLLLALLLSACDSYADPYAARAAADEAIRATQRAIAAERVALTDQERQAQEAVMQTAQAAQIEIDLLYAQAAATQTAIANDLAALDIALASSQATREAVGQQATVTAIAVMAENESARAARQAQQADFLANATPMILLIILLAGVALMVILVAWVWKFLDWTLEWRDRKASLYHTPAGTIAFIGNVPQLMTAERNERWSYTRLPAVAANTDAQAVTWISPSVAASAMPTRPEPDPLRVEAIRLVSQIAAEDGDVLDLPGWRELDDWTSSRWQRAVDYLRAKQLIQKIGQSWQFVSPAQDILFRLQLPGSAS